MPRATLRRLFLSVMIVLSAACSIQDTEFVRVRYRKRPAALINTPVTLNGQTVGAVRQIVDTWPGVTLLVNVKRNVLPKSAVFFFTHASSGDPEIVVYSLDAVPGRGQPYVGTDSAVELGWLRTVAKTKTGLIELERWVNEVIAGSSLEVRH